MIVWFTGLSGAGKTTLARALAERLSAGGVRCFVLDGDVLRDGLNKGLGFSDADRRENIRRIAEVAKLFALAGVVPIISAITPKKALRALAKDIVGGEQYREVFIDCPLDECERRDVKGLYKRARSGELPGFTGIGDPFEPPDDPTFVVRTDRTTIAEAVEQLHIALLGRA